MLVTIIPSYINTLKRYKFCKRSFASFRDNGGANYPHIIIDDKPRTYSLIDLPFKKILDNAVTEIYSKKNTTIIRRPVGSLGSRSALLEGAIYAKKMGFDHVFIHLDDNVYIRQLESLLEHSISVLERNKELQLIRLTGRPILSHLCNQIKGNTSKIRISKDNVSFEKINLKPRRYKTFTLWSSNYDTTSIQNYWLIAMWSCVYKTDFLINLLLTTKDVMNLGDVEVFFQNKENWKEFLQRNPGRFGYINMQFCGLESHRNTNWKELINYPNRPII